MSNTGFRGTLLLLQNRTRRDPESYKEEFLAQLEHFKASSATVASQHTANPQYMAVLNYVCHVSHCFPKESITVAKIVMELLRSSRGCTLPQELRTALVKCLMLLRAKDIVSADDTFPILFMLLQEKDKDMRKRILSHIVSDIRKANMPSAKGGATTNKKAQNFLFSVMAEDDPVQARCAETVMIDLYRRRVWCDERTVEVMTQACFSRHTTIVRTALRFFLMQMPKISSVDDEDGEGDEQDPGRSISKLKQKLKIVKKTTKRDRVLKRNMKDIKRKYSKSEKEEEMMKQHVDPIRLLRDPHQLVERLLAKLQRTSERFEVRILYLNVIARAVSEHEVIHLPLYGFLERYMEPSQLHATQLLALSSMCVHHMTPPDAVEPLVKAIANHFVSDRSSPDAITVGINTIREICKRQPLAMNEDLLKDLAEYKNQRGDKGVIMAARALIQLYREVYPDLLPAKMRGSKAVATPDRKKPVYGAQHVFTDIPGLELLYQVDENSEDGSNRDLSSLDSDSEDGEWVTDSDSEVDPNDIDGEFVNVSDADDNEECPQLVPAAGTKRGTSPPSAEGSAPTAKRPRIEDGPDTTASDDGEGESSDEAADESLSGEDSSEWEMDDGEEEEEDGSEMEEGSEVDEESEMESRQHVTLSEALAGANGPWVVDTEGGSEASQRGTPSVASTGASHASISSSRVLSDADFEKIRKLQAQKGSHLSLRGKLKQRETRSKHRHDLIHGISNDLSAHDIEHFTQKKRDTDKQSKIERAQELRKATSKFELRKKTKSKLNSTHGEHSKRGKLFQMTKRSARVATKLKSSVADRANRAKEMKKKDIKFRIKRGWKA